MGKSATTTVEIQGIEIAIPVGSMDPPTAEAVADMNTIENAENWKLATGIFSTTNKDRAENLCYALDWYLGGHEMIETWSTDGTEFLVCSKGYYHYIGA